MHRFFASAPRGVEQVLADELRSLGALEVSPGVAGVSFAGDMDTGCRACLWSRVASRILLTVARFDASTVDKLYRGVRGFDWLQYMRPQGTLAVDFSTRGQTGIGNTHFGALKVKDAIVDRIREETSLRPSIDLDRPDLRVCVHVDGETATMSLDMSGESLHRRGYRAQGTVAPLKENLAAAILMTAGWPKAFREGGALLDPMCGSGTFLVEAALMATDTAPGLLHAPFGFTRWKGFRPEGWNALLDEARRRDRRQDPSIKALPIFGYDMDATAVKAARANANKAGLGNLVRIDQRELSFTERPEGFEKGILVANPPYGERLGEIRALARLYRRLGDVLKQRLAGWDGFIFTGNLDLAKEVGLKAVRRHVLFNGAIECRLLEIPVRAGSFERDRTDGETPPSVKPAALDVEAQEQGATESSGRSQTSDHAGSAESDASRPSVPGISEAAQGFANRLAKNFKRLSKWAAREGVSCYRVYDADLPDYAVAVDIYERWVHVQEYAPPKTVEPRKAERRLQEALAVIPGVLGVLPSDIHLKVRQRQKGSSQYGKFGGEGTFYQVSEGGLKFLVNLSDYLDTGLFLDHRPIRTLIGQRSKGRRFLNLFGYTGTATVHAAAGGASSSVTVDLSNTYLDWARRNLAINGLDDGRHLLIRGDATRWMASAHGHFDLIFIDPPTFSKSKSMDGVFDVQRDHRALIDEALKLLNPGGELFFSTNLRNFRFNGEGLERWSPKDITRQTIPPDFQRDMKIHHCWQLTDPRDP